MGLRDNNEQLITDLQAVIEDAETLLTNAAASGSEDFKTVKARIENTIKNAKEEIVRLEQLVVHKTKEAARATDTYVHENPWQAVGLGAAIGLVVGLLISRR